jgi:hypothetical protein
VPQVSILRRDRVPRQTAPGELEEQVSVLYATTAIPPTVVYRDPSDYRDPTPEERDANPRMIVVPVGPDAAARESTAIAIDIAARGRGRAETIDLP